MKNPKIVLSKIAHFNRLKPFRASAALILTTLMLVVAAATSVATAQTYTDLYNFHTSDGASPAGPLAQGRDGNLYGTAPGGGPNGAGVVFRVTPRGKLTVLYNFSGGDGWAPYSGLTLGTDGNFYGTTNRGSGASSCGTIFKITQSGGLTTLYFFTGGTDGCNPETPPIQGADGNFYGTTPHSSGTVYKITSSGTFTPLRGSLPGPSSAPLVQGTNGNFYGTTNGSGDTRGRPHGTVFKITRNGILTVVHTFDVRSSHPYGPVIQGSDGNFYGTTANGGSPHAECGTVFKLTAPRTFTVLHDFGDVVNDGKFPYAGLVQATDGNFYGVTADGGTLGNGVIFQVTPTGDYSILHNFDDMQWGPQSAPIQHTNGKLYGLADGGTYGAGVVYSLDLGFAPFVSLVSITGKVGKTIEVLGQGFIGTTAVSFNGTAATFTVVSDTYLKTTVPSGATTGVVTVTTPTGTLTSNKPFRVKP